MRHVVLELLAERPSLESFKDDFLPWFCKLSYRKSHRNKYLQCRWRAVQSFNVMLMTLYPPFTVLVSVVGPAFRVPLDPQSLAIQYSSIPYTRSDAKQPPKSLSKLPVSTSHRDSPAPSQSTDEGAASHGALSQAAAEGLQDDPLDPNSLRCGVTLHRLKDGYAGRANTIGAYLELNRQVLACGW